LLFISTESLAEEKPPIGSSTSSIAGNDFLVGFFDDGVSGITMNPIVQAREGGGGKMFGLHGNPVAWGNVIGE
jgi:hypothetical protein